MDGTREFLEAVGQQVLELHASGDAHGAAGGGGRCAGGGCGTCGRGGGRGGLMNEGTLSEAAEGD